MEDNEITQRLRDAGDQPVPGQVRTSHLSQMHAASPTVEKPKRFGRLAVAAAAFVGFAVGSTGFAMAGALPDPAQQVAHDVLAVVQVNVENPRNRGQCVSEIAKSDMPEADKELAKAKCPKGGPPEGVGKGRPDHAGKPGGPNGPPHDGNPCKGPPPWAGKGAKDVPAQDKQAFADARAACQPDADDSAEDDALEQQREAEEERLEQEAEAQEEQREAQQDQQEAEQVPAEQPPTDPGTPAPQAEESPAPELPAPLDPNAGADTETQDTDPEGADG